MSDSRHSWEQVGGPIQSLDASNSDYLMPTKVPLNRVIFNLRFLEVDLRTSLGTAREVIQDQIQDQIQDPDIQDF